MFICVIRAVHEYHAHAHAHAHHNMGYGGLLLGGARLPTHHAQYKAVEWGAQHHTPHHLDPTTYTYPTMAG